MVAGPLPGRRAAWSHAPLSVPWHKSPSVCPEASIYSILAHGGGVAACWSAIRRPSPVWPLLAGRCWPVRQGNVSVPFRQPATKRASRSGPAQGRRARPLHRCTAAALQGATELIVVHARDASRAAGRSGRAAARRDACSTNCPGERRVYLCVCVQAVPCRLIAPSALLHVRTSNPSSAILVLAVQNDPPCASTGDKAANQ